MTGEEWFAHWWPIWAPVVLLLLGGTVTGVWTIVNRRGGERAARTSPLPPTWPEMWARIDALQKRIDDLEDELDTFRRDDARFRDALARWLTRVSAAWGQAEAMPWPPARDLAILQPVLPVKKEKP